MSALNYNVIGSGKEHIIFIHHENGNAESWKWVAKKLRTTHTCYVLNLPGFNETDLSIEPSIYSYAIYINEQIASLKLDKYTLCGHAMGSKIGLYAALMNESNKPEKIILVAPASFTTENLSTYSEEYSAANSNKETVAKSIQKLLVRRLKKSKLDLAVRTQLKINPAVKNWWINEGMKYDISEAVKNVQIPTFVICSKEDPVVPLDSVYTNVMPFLSMGTLIAVSRVGHLMPLESPRKLGRHIQKISKIKYHTVSS